MSTTSTYRQICASVHAYYAIYRGRPIVQNQVATDMHTRQAVAHNKHTHGCSTQSLLSIKVPLYMSNHVVTYKQVKQNTIHAI